MRAILLVAALSAAAPAYAGGRGGSGPVRVRAHVTKGGSYVAPHVRTKPNSTKIDNYSTKGNTNPYTGAEGTKKGDGPYGPGR